MQNQTIQQYWRLSCVTVQLVIWNLVRATFIFIRGISSVDYEGLQSTGNYGSVLRDCSKALGLNPKSSKAYYRSALALTALERLEEAVDCCVRCLVFDPQNTAVQALENKAKEAQEAKVKKEEAKKA